MARTLGAGQLLTFHQSLYDCEASIYKTKERGGNYQFRMYIKEAKRLCKEFGFTAGMLKGSLTEGRKPKS